MSRRAMKINLHRADGVRLQKNTRKCRPWRPLVDVAPTADMLRKCNVYAKENT